MGDSDDATIGGLEATPARALEHLAVVRRQPDGTWRWATDMWNSDAG
jgi:ketosteroid isomerase-like protein